MPLSLRLRTLATLAFVAVADVAHAQDASPVTPYTPTLTYGTGLINVPTAWVSPISGDVWFSLSSRAVAGNDLSPTNFRSSLDQTLNVDAHFYGRLSVGGSVYNVSNEQVGGFAQALLVRSSEDSPRWLPSVAVGVRAVGASGRQDRYLTGASRVVDRLGLPPGGALGQVDGAPTIYAVATKEFHRDRLGMSLTAGYGTGLFKNDGGLGTRYNVRFGTAGAFGGVRITRATAREGTFFSVLGELDGFDLNAGAMLTLNHVNIGLMLTEIEESKERPGPGQLAGWTKVGIVLGYNGNLADMWRGSQQRAEVTELELEARHLRREVAQREVRRRELERSIAKAQRAADQSAAAQRAALERQLEQEREAIKKASERLDQVKRAKPPEGR
ncbi:MAG: hypothetical protein K2X99_02220 [Gemmatimonadaceae bacterium]|nr:hypothetical protein [Gemmatimonadaceae bacterium]